MLLSILEESSELSDPGKMSFFSLTSLALRMNTIRWAFVMSHFCSILDVHLLDHEPSVGRDFRDFLLSLQWLAWYLHRPGDLQMPGKSGGAPPAFLLPSLVLEVLGRCGSLDPPSFALHSPL